MNAPRILLSPWRQSLPTTVAAEEDLLTVGMAYVEAIRSAGGVALLAAHPVDAAETASLLDIADGVVITGGQDIDPGGYGADDVSSYSTQPDADAADLRLLRAALDRKVPVLGVCRGLQLANVAFGGDLVQEVQSKGDADHPLVDPRKNHAHRHRIEIEAGTRLAAIYGAGGHDVGSLHHQAVARVGAGLVVSARTADGTVEAIEAEAHDLLAVQWHPELLVDGHELFVDLVERAG